jgi:hydroxymethylglutaryl-CoA reductase (NADPH)
MASNSPITAARLPLQPRVPAGGPDHESIDARWAVLGSAASREELLDEKAVHSARRYSSNIENFIGTVRVPVGAIGPLRVHGGSGTRDYYVPLATTEAALVASYGRGALLVSAAGGCSARTTHQTISRAPGFVFDSLADSGRFVEWVATVRARFEVITAGTSRHTRLESMRPVIDANHVHLVLDYRTGDAAGQNMITIATQAIVQYIRDAAPVPPRRAYVEANLSGDKKATVQSLLLGRGRSATADVVIPGDLVRQRLRATPDGMEAYCHMASVAGALSGSVGVQGHYANGLAALFLACGQDVACVAECAVGITRLEARPDGSLYASVTLPSLAVGTVGGGTALPTQRACLDVIGLQGPDSANAFAELCAATALAGEISIIGAIVADEFTRAHARLARGTVSRAHRAPRVVA